MLDRHLMVQASISNYIGSWNLVNRSFNSGTISEHARTSKCICMAPLRQCVGRRQKYSFVKYLSGLPLAVTSVAGLRASTNFLTLFTHNVNSYVQFSPQCDLFRQIDPFRSLKTYMRMDKVPLSRALPLQQPWPFCEHTHTLVSFTSMIWSAMSQLTHTRKQKLT